LAGLAGARFVAILHRPVYRRAFAKIKNKNHQHYTGGFDMQDASFI